MLRRSVLLLLLIALLTPLAMVRISQAGASSRATEERGSLVVYCGRGKALVGPMLERFSAETGIQIEVRYAGSTDLATLLIEEGHRSPADVFISQDPGALGAVAERGMFSALPTSIVERVPEAYRDASSRWVGLSGRARVLAWSTERVERELLPKSVFELVEPQWRGRVAWAPQNASFQLFVSAMRRAYGDEATRAWLEGMKANGVRDYPGNRPILQAIADGKADIGLANHYYLAGFVRERGAAFPVANHYLRDDIGGMLSVSGAGVLRTSSRPEASRRLVEFLLSEDVQRRFADEISELPLVAGVGSPEGCPDVREFAECSYMGSLLDLGSLSDVQGTLDLLRRARVLP